MAGKVFLSCGQNDRELAIAEKIASLLKGEPFGLNVFIARETNNLFSLNKEVLQNLANSDYFLFVNFCRSAARFPGSIYAHQELAMALAVGHEHVLLYSEKDAPNEGVILFMVQNRPQFLTTEELLEQIRKDVEREQWSSDYSRFLRAKRLDRRVDVIFRDGVGNVLRGTSIGVVIENQSSDLQDGIIVTLDTLDGNEPQYWFRSPLKVSAQRRFDAGMPPKSEIIFDVLMEGTCTSFETRAGVFLVSALDFSPLPALFEDQNDHEMVFRIDARMRRPIRFKLLRRNGDYILS